MDILKTIVQESEEKDAIIEGLMRENEVLRKEREVLRNEIKEAPEKKTSEPQHDSGNDQEPGDSCIWRKIMFRLMIKEVEKTNGKTFPKLKLWGHPEGGGRPQNCKEGLVYNRKWYKIKDNSFAISYDFKTVTFYNEGKTNKGGTYDLKSTSGDKKTLDISNFSITRSRILLTHMITVMNE
jgi:hypothetical protein